MEQARFATSITYINMMSTNHLIPSPTAVTSHRGHIQIIFGPMFSGKTTELMRLMKRYQVANHSCLIVKYAKDTRYDNHGIATHDRTVLSATAAHELMSLIPEALKYDVIGIDEGQFFPDVVVFADTMAEKGKVVIVAALDATFQKKGFGDILNLVPLAEHVMKLSAVCMNCYNEASFTKRKGNETEVEVIGGKDKYLAVCRACFRGNSFHQQTNTTTE
ncbi:thymidine kinase, cytosolic-like isoform X1 [Haliotis rufescens]|uniref:thymidine kinase, cytosolic-like isoform X1 n=1 Tax=Haliotis rufescens TaxID=6454 RepID=UPI001EB022EB|nr:thymidine kinase, cytosolic-like isoform X1 [Haliotis rufescens]